MGVGGREGFKGLGVGVLEGRGLSIGGRENVKGVGYRGKGG